MTKKSSERPMSPGGFHPVYPHIYFPYLISRSTETISASVLLLHESQDIIHQPVRLSGMSHYGRHSDHNRLVDILLSCFTAACFWRWIPRFLCYRPLRWMLR